MGIAAEDLYASQILTHSKCICTCFAVYCEWQWLPIVEHNTEWTLDKVFFMIAPIQRLTICD